MTYHDAFDHLGNLRPAKPSTAQILTQAALRLILVAAGVWCWGLLLHWMGS